MYQIVQYIWYLFVLKYLIFSYYIEWISFITKKIYTKTLIYNSFLL